MGAVTDYRFEEEDLRRPGDPEPPQPYTGLGLAVRVALVVWLPPVLFVLTAWALGWLLR